MIIIYSSLFDSDIDSPMSWEIFQDLADYTTVTPPGIEFHCIHGSNVDTLEL